MAQIGAGGNKMQGNLSDHETRSGVAALSRDIFRVIFHLSPLIVAGLGQILFAVVAMVVVALTYIKANKFNAHLSVLLEADEVAKGAIEDTLSMRARWTYLTFLKWPARG